MSFLIEWIFGSVGDTGAPFPTLPESWIAPGFCAHEVPWPEGALSQPRSLLPAPSNDVVEGGGGILVLDRDLSAVVLLTDGDGDGVVGDEATILISIPKDDFSDGVGLTHGLEWSLLTESSGYLYASTPGKVLRWTMTLANDGTILEVDEASMKIVIDQISSDGSGGAPLGHRTRTLILDDENRFLYVAIGSNGNVDENSYRSRIRRFDLSVVGENDYPLAFETGEIFADGLRNTVGVGWDAAGVMWGVDMGADNLVRGDLGGDIHNDNPGDELNRFPDKPADGTTEAPFYGYPYCFSEADLSGGDGAGTQWAWPTTMDGPYDDAYCKNTSSVVPPVVVMPAHSSPLGVAFYQYNDTLPQDCDPSQAFPASLDGYAFVTYHGSWNRDPPTGYKVVYFPVDNNDEVAGEFPVHVDLLKHEEPFATWTWGFRPVDVAFDRCGRLLVSSDGTFNVGGGTVVQVYASDVCPAAATVGLLAKLSIILSNFLYSIINSSFCVWLGNLLRP